MSSHWKQYETRPISACESSNQSADRHLPPEEYSAYSARRSPYGRLWDWKHSPMKSGESLPPRDANEEVFALIEVLHETEQRLEEMTAGKLDAVVDRHGRPFLLRRPQEQLRHIAAANQAVILNALPAHIALLDARGRIISVNEAWRRFGSAHVTQGPGYGIGLNYLEVCDGARGDGSSEAHQAAAGIRSVLSGGVKSFSIEYPCHSPTEQRWFLLMVRPLAGDRPNGAVVMHLDVKIGRA